jgi:hypothetical protein
MDNRCSYDTCPKASICKGLCEQHYLMQFVQPLQKERRNSKDLLAIINANIADAVQQLYKAKHPNEQAAMFRRPDGTWTNTAKVFCHNCWKPFDGAMECWRHEQDCKGKPSGAKRRASAPSIPTTKEMLIDDGEVINDV